MVSLKVVGEVGLGSVGDWLAPACGRKVSCGVLVVATGGEKLRGLEVMALELLNRYVLDPRWLPAIEFSIIPTCKPSLATHAATSELLIIQRSVIT